MGRVYHVVSHDFFKNIAQSMTNGQNLVKPEPLVLNVHCEAHLKTEDHEFMDAVNKKRQWFGRSGLHLFCP